MAGAGRAKPRPLPQFATRQGQLQDAATALPALDADHQVAALLKECGLQMYTVQLLQNGFDELETLHEVDDEDLKQLGIPPYHAARLRKALQELQEHGAGMGTRGVAVASFLEEHGLAQYSSMLLGHGFDEMETLYDVDDADLKELGMSRGHALKLRRHLREDQLNAHAAAPPEVLAHHAQPAARAANHPRASHAAASAGRMGHHHLDATDTMKGDVQRSWEKIQEVGTLAVCDHVITAFFELVPETMDCFPVHVRLKYKEWTADEGEEEGDLASSVALRRLFAKVLNVLGSVVAGLQDPSKLVPLLTSLGARHITYGVDYSYWPALGQAINQTLRDLLGKELTPEVENAWSIVYGFVSSIMIEGLRTAREEAAAVVARIADAESAASWRSGTTVHVPPALGGHDETSRPETELSSMEVHRSTSGSTIATEAQSQSQSVR